MTHRDIYIKFMIGYDKANVTSSYPSLTEYEIATFLDKAYLALIAQKVTGNNSRHIGFEQDLKVTEDLGPLIKTTKEFLFDQNPLPYVHNAIKWPLPSDWLYFVSGELQRGGTYGKQWDIRLIDHNTASKFYTTAYNIPWIKRPVCYIEGNEIYTLYDSIYQASGAPSLTLTYIKTPKKFMVDDGTSNDVVDNDEIPPRVTGAYQNGSEVSIHAGEYIRIKCENGSFGNLSFRYNHEIISVIREEEDDTYLTITGLHKGSTRLEITNTYFTNWSYILNVIVVDGDESVPPVVELTGSNEMEVDSTRTITCYYTGNPDTPIIDCESSDTSILVVQNISRGIITIRARRVGTASILITSSNHPEWAEVISFTVVNPSPSITEYNSSMGTGIYYVKGEILFGNLEYIFSITNPVFKLVAGRGYVDVYMYGKNNSIYTYNEGLNTITLQSISNELLYNSMSLEDICNIIKQRIIYTLIHDYSVSAKAGNGTILQNLTSNPTAYIIMSDGPESEPTVTDEINLTVGDVEPITVLTSNVVSAQSSNDLIVSFDNLSSNTLDATANSVGTATGIIFTEDSFEAPLKINFIVSAASGVTLEHDYLGQYFALNFHQVSSSGGGHSPAPTPVIQVNEIHIAGEDIFDSSDTVTKHSSTGISPQLIADINYGSSSQGGHYIVASSILNYNTGDSLNVNASGVQKFAVNSNSITGTVSVPVGGELRLYFVADGTVAQVFGTIKNVALQNPTITTAPIMKGSLIYNATNQELIYPGTVTGGTMYYSKNGGEWSTSVPTAKDAMTYSIAYKVVGDTGYTNIDSTSLGNVTIAQKVITITWDTTTFRYDGQPHIPTIHVSGIESVDTTITCDVTGALTLVGTYTATVELNGNNAYNYALPANKTNQFRITGATITDVLGTNREIAITVQNTINIGGGTIASTNGITMLQNGCLSLISSTDTSVTVEALAVGRCSVTIRCTDGSEFVVSYNIIPRAQVSGLTLRTIDVGDQNTIVPSNANDVIVNAEVSNNKLSCSIIGTNVVNITALEAGTCVVTVTFGDHTTSQVEYTINAVNLPLPEIAWSAAEFMTKNGDTTGKPTLTNPHNVTITYSSSNPNIATIDSDGNITVLKYQKCQIIATSTEGNGYASQTVSYLLNNSPRLILGPYSLSNPGQGWRELQVGWVDTVEAVNCTVQNAYSDEYNDNNISISRSGNVITVTGQNATSRDVRLYVSVDQYIDQYNGYVLSEQYRVLAPTITNAYRNLTQGGTNTFSIENGTISSMNVSPAGIISAQNSGNDVTVTGVSGSTSGNSATLSITYNNRPTAELQVYYTVWPASSQSTATYNSDEPAKKVYKLAPYFYNTPEFVNESDGQVVPVRYLVLNAGVPVVDSEGTLYEFTYPIVKLSWDSTRNENGAYVVQMVSKSDASGNYGFYQRSTAGALGSQSWDTQMYDEDTKRTEVFATLAKEALANYGFSGNNEVIASDEPARFEANQSPWPSAYINLPSVYPAHSN